MSLFGHGRANSTAMGSHLFVCWSEELSTLEEDLLLGTLRR